MKTILIVDDSADNVLLMCAYFTKLCFICDTAENGEQAVAKSLFKNYDLILMDVSMPVMDGLEAVKIMRKQGYKGHIVALTAHAMPDDREKFLCAGFNDYLAKPVMRSDLMDYLEKTPA